MDRRLFNRAGGGLLVGFAGLFASSARAAEEPKPHRMIFQVSSGNPKLMNLVLHNVQNAATYYQSKGEKVAIEIVAFGPGYLMVRDISPMKADIAAMHQKLPFVVFSACQNSRRGVAKQEGKKPDEIAELPEATDVPSGVVRVSQLQEQGWSYIRP